MPPIERLTRSALRLVICAAAMLAMTVLNAQSDNLAGAGGEQAAGASVAGAPDLSSATTIIDRLHHAFVEMAASGGDLDARFARLLPVVQATHDLAFIAELTIRRQWRDLDDAARLRFVAAFERLSVTTYASRFASVTPATFRIVGAEKREDGRAEVSAEIMRPEAAPVTLEYILQQEDDDWRIVAIVADGVNDVALKRAQYQRVLRNGGTIDDVIAEIERETAAL